MKKWLAICFATVLLLVGCSKKEEVSEKEDSSAKDELVLAVGKVDNGLFDPKKGWGTHSQIRLTHSSLLTIDKDLNFIGDLATDYSISDDALTWSFKLNPEAKFSNGEPVTAEDVKFTYEMLQADGVKFDLAFVKELVAKDNHTLDIVLTEPRSTFVSQLTEIGIVPAKYYDDNYSTNPIGSGPYQVVQYDDGQQIIMTYNEHWYGQEPQIKKLTFLLLEEDAALAAAKTGQADVVYVPPSLADQKITGMTLQSFESVDSRGIMLPTLPSGNKGQINGNDVKVGNDVTSDLAIRQALNIGLDRQALIDVALAGYGKEAFCLCDHLPWFNEETAFKDGNIEKAKKILLDAGWQDSNGDGIVEKDGNKATFDLLFNSADQLRSDLSLAVADQAEQLGIKINAIGTTWDDIYVKGKENAVAWGGGRLHPHQLYTMYSSESLNQGYNNMPQYQNEKVDDYINQALVAPSLEASYELWKKAQWDGETGFGGEDGDAPMIWLTRIDHLYFAKEGINFGNQPMHSHGHEWALFMNITEWTWQ